MYDAIDEAVSLVGVEPIAALVVGSHLYGTVINPHDIDIAIFVPFGKGIQVMSGDLDVHVISLEFLLRTSAKGYLFETDASLGLLYGYGSWYDHPYKAALQGFRPSIFNYADTVRRFEEKNPEAQKHIIRYNIFLERFWRTGNADPRLTREERQRWLEQLTG